MGRVTHGDVLAGLRARGELVPFGGEHAYKAFALAVGLQMLVDALAGERHGAVLLVARPEHDPVPGARELAPGRAAARRSLRSAGRRGRRRSRSSFAAVLGHAAPGVELSARASGADAPASLSPSSTSKQAAL